MGTNQLGQAGSVHELGTGVSRRVDEQGIQHRSAWSIQSIDSVARLDVNVDHLVAVMKRRRSDRGRVCGLEAFEQAPAMQLKNSASHEGVSGKRVGTVATPIDDEDPESSASQQHGGGGAGAAGPDHDGVVYGTVVRISVHGSKFLSVRRRR
jgi:hypothetical protein